MSLKVVPEEIDGQFKTGINKSLGLSLEYYSGKRKLFILLGSFN